MKGIEAIHVVMIIVLAVFILAILIWWGGQAKGTIDIVLIQTTLRQCCSDRAIWNCLDPTSTIECNVPWSDDTETLYDLADRAGITDTQLPDFCNCE